jgi:hypothetical protein
MPLLCDRPLSDADECTFSQGSGGRECSDREKQGRIGIYKVRRSKLPQLNLAWLCSTIPCRPAAAFQSHGICSSSRSYTQPAADLGQCLKALRHEGFFWSLAIASTRVDNPTEPVINPLLYITPALVQ